MTTGRAVFSVRPWQDRDGNVGNPAAVIGIDVARRLCRRHDAPGAFVTLVDRRYALTGPLIAVGPALEMQRFLRRRARNSALDPDRAWLDRAHQALISDIVDRRRASSLGSR